MAPIEPQVAFESKPAVASVHAACPSNFQPMVKPDDFDVGAALNALIARSGKQKLALATHIGVSEQAVQKWIKQGKIAREKVREICLFLGCSADELLGLIPIRDDTTAPASQSQPVRLDAEMLADTAWVMRKAYADVGRVFDLEEEPERFLQAYLARTKLTDIQSPDNVAAFLFTAAKLVSPQGASDERINKVPTPGTGKTDVGGRTRRRKA